MVRAKNSLTGVCCGKHLNQNVQPDTSGDLDHTIRMWPTSVGHIRFCCCVVAILTVDVDRGSKSTHTYAFAFKLLSFFTLLAQNVGTLSIKKSTTHPSDIVSSYP